MRLICFAHAGGSAPLCYRRWSESLGAAAQVHPVELPGHGRRVADPVLTELDAVVEDVLPAVRAMATRPYALFGHSFGAVVAFEVARRLTLEQGGAGPAMLFVSGRRPPDQPARYGFHHRADAELIEELAGLGGLPAPLLSVPALLAAMLPTLRADLEMSEDYYRGAEAELACPITALVGDADPLVTPSQIAGWRRFTTGPFEVEVTAGGHFYLEDREVMERIRRRIDRVRTGSRPRLRHRVGRPAAASWRWPQAKRTMQNTPTITL